MKPTKLPNAKFYKLSAREATRVASEVARLDGDFSWPTFVYWTEAYAKRQKKREKVMFMEQLPLFNVPRKPRRS